MQFSNPRREASFDDWPSGRARVRCRFWIESDPKKGERVCRQTEDKHGRPCKPKKTTYAPRFAIVDGDDGRTYTLEFGKYGGGSVRVGSSDLVHDVETVYQNSDPERYAELGAMFGQAVCPNCGQWQREHHPAKGHREAGNLDCLNECVARGFAPNRQAGGQ